MSLLSWYGLGALALIGGIFYFVRKISAYAALCLLTVVGFAGVTFPVLDLGRPSEWLVMTFGLLLCVFGLLIVRVMLVRSVSLRLLRTIDEGQAEHMSDDIGGRLADMRGFGLIKTDGERCTLTPFGRLVGGVVATFYSLFRIAA
jgi:hypothetical protein